MLCDRVHEGSGAVKLGGYIHIFRTIALPPTSPSHNICLSETLVTLLMKETRVAPKRRYLTPKVHGVTSWMTRAVLSAVLF